MRAFRNHALSLVCALAVALLLQACDTARRMQTAVRAESEKAAQVDRIDIPTTQMMVQINGGEAGRMLLGRVEDGVEQWIATDGLSIWTREGRIVATSGLRDDLHNLHVLSNAPPALMASGSGRAEPLSWQFYAQLDSQPLGLILETRIDNAEPSVPVRLGSSSVRLTRVTESLLVPDTGEEWTNDYWVDARSGRVLITRQKLPGLPYEIRMELLPRSPSNAGGG